MPERSHYAAGIPSWVDLATADPARAREFYGPLFGWEFAVGGEEYGYYTTILKDGKGVAGLVGMPSTDNPPAWTTYFASDDAAATAEAAREHGATIVFGPHPVGDLGAMLGLVDPTGAFVGVWQAGTHTGAQLVNEPGSFIWTELLTRDFDAAVAFYTTVFPTTAASMIAEEGMRYDTLQVGGQDIAGIWEATDELAAGRAPHWSVYFCVTDTDRAVATAQDLGAAVAVEAHDSPYGRFARLTDPQGADFTVIANT